MSSLIVKISKNGSSQEFIFNKMGPIVIGSHTNCDLNLEDSDLDPKILEIKVSGGNIFIKSLCSTKMFLGPVILPHKSEVRYREGEFISIQESSYQISIAKNAVEAMEPPPFYEGEFKERLVKMTNKIREKESELRALAMSEEKKRAQIGNLEEKFQKNTTEKSRLEIEVSSLKTKKEDLGSDLKRQAEKKGQEESRIQEYRDFVKRLENEEKSLKDTIIAQNMILASLKSERDQKNKEVDKQRVILANLQLETAQMENQRLELMREKQNHEQEHQVETIRVQKILNHSESAMRESARVQNHIAHLMKEKTILDHDVQDLNNEIKKLEETRKDTYGKLQELNRNIDACEAKSLKVQEQIQRHTEDETNLRHLNNELRSELVKAEEKLSIKKNVLNQIEFQHQDASRKLSTVNFELERATLHLQELTSEEKSQELKMMSLREDFQNMVRRSGEDKKIFQKNLDDEKFKLSLELTTLKGEIEEAKRVLAKVESDEELVQVEIDDLNARHRLLNKEKVIVENEVMELKAQKSMTESQIQNLKSETLKFEHEKSRAQRELSQLQIKLMDLETQITEKHEEAKLDLENFKREERAKMMAEKNVYLAEVEAFKQKSLIEVESEYRKKQDDLHRLKQIAQESADEIVREARVAEAQITEEATSRLKKATIDAQEREMDSHTRMKEAQEYFKAKEQEAEAIIQKSRLDSRDYLRRTEVELQDELTKRKTKIKKFLTMKQDVGLNHIKMLHEQSIVRMKRNEEKAHQKLEDLKKRELKKVARIRDEELNKNFHLKEEAMKEFKVHKEKLLAQISDIRKTQEKELAEKKKTVLEHINSTKFQQQKAWEDEVRRERELFTRTKKERINNATQAVMNILVSESHIDQEKADLLKQKVKANLEMAIDGQSAGAMKDVEQILDFNPMKRKKVLPVLQKYALSVGLPAVIAIVVMADIGSFRTSTVNLAKDLMRQRNSASEMYVAKQKTEWKEKNTYNPPLTVGYKPTYVENILYTQDFEKVMENEEFQNEWILKVHDFLVVNLELSEDLAINFISAEGTLLKELSQERKNIHPDLLENSLKKMHELEKTHLGWINEKIVEEAKRKKFAEFRKNYYEKFWGEKFSKGRALAGKK